MLAVGLTLGAVVNLPGCAPKPTALSLEELEQRKITYLGDVIETHERIQQQLLARAELEYQHALAAGRPDDRVFDVLILSGGGAKGAFGAGFLVGWGEVKDPQMARPEFDLVTGVSTGSLIAPLAFLGDEASYARADQIYREPGEDWIKKRGLLEVLFKEDSLFSDEGLFGDVQRTFEPTIPAIAAEAAEHRLLLIGATNLNQGDSRIWNLTDLAVKVQEGKMTSEEYCRHCISSASIPVAFPPQIIDGNLYVDGSTTRDILYVAAFDSRESALVRWRELHPGVKPPKFRIWVIANTSLVVPPVTVDPRDISVLSRSLALAVGEGLLSQMRNLELSSRLMRDELGCEVEFRYVALPDGFAPKGPGMFNKHDMDEMSDIGAAMGRDPSSWLTTVPDPLSPTELRDEMERQLREQREAATRGQGVGSM